MKKHVILVIVVASLMASAGMLTAQNKYVVFHTGN
jgi:hypothetical protein